MTVASHSWCQVDTPNDITTVSILARRAKAFSWHPLDWQSVIRLIMGVPTVLEKVLTYLLLPSILISHYLRSPSISVNPLCSEKKTATYVFLHK